MCSNTSSGSYGELADDYSGSNSISSLKKHKKDHNNNNKVRRRGPGVAELEKIRLQEENHNSNSTTPTSTPPPLILNDLVMLPDKQQQQQQQASRITPPIFPFSSYIVNGSNFPKDFIIPPPPIFQRKQSSLNQMNNQTNAGLFQFLEPPSNQKHPLDHFSQFLEDEKMIGMKRPWHFFTDTKATIGAISRDGKQNRSLDLRLKSPVQDSGTTICNPITIDSPSQQQLPLTSIRSFPRDFPRFIPLNLQYEQHQQQQQEIDEYMQRRSGGNVSLNRKPFYSFIPLDDQSINGDRNKHFTLKNERYEAATAAADHGIDLRLKL